MEEIKVLIKKQYAKEVIKDLEKMDAIEIKRDASTDLSTLVGSWRSQSIAEVDRELEKMRNEWERNSY